MRPEAWPAYNQLWTTLLGTVAESGVPVVFLSPLTPLEFAAAGGSELQARWLLLDCPDAVRRARLRDRGWDDRSTKEAVDDAEELRELVPEHLDTAAMLPAEIAVLIACEAGA